ncbi:hypothetical protein, partial [Haloquadratum walsbyi]|uniref:hypothetical protein n=1 Tax=Haloquadratum walsbyi TaxID=293091 RepID=UPI001AD8CE63
KHPFLLWNSGCSKKYLRIPCRDRSNGWLAQPGGVIETATNLEHPNPAARCRGNLRPSGRRGCQILYC